MLEEYLKQLQAEALGDGVDQRFTVDLQAQARKLATFQEREPALWLLKMVQAAVASGAPGVRLRRNREFLEARFSPPILSEPAQLVSACQGWQEHLRLALLLALSSPSSGVYLNWGERVLQGRAGQLPAQPGEIALRLQRPGQWWSRLLDWQGGHIHKSLSWRCALAPIPVIFDGRRLNTPYLERALPGPLAGPGAFESSRRYRWLAQSNWVSDSKPGFPLSSPMVRRPHRLLLDTQIPLTRPPVEPHTESVHHQVHSPTALAEWNFSHGTYRTDVLKAAIEGMPNWNEVVVFSLRAKAFGESSVRYLESPGVALPALREKSPVFTGEYSPMRCSRWFGLAAHLDEPAGLTYLKDGVRLNPVQTACRFRGSNAIVADSPILTDLSQLQVVEDDTVRADLEWLREQEHILSEQCRDLIFDVRFAEDARIPQMTRDLWRQQLA